MTGRTLAKRLESLEAQHTARAHLIARGQAVESMTDEELDTYLEDLRAYDPEAMERVEAMTDEELDTHITRLEASRGGQK